jgi:hypothetical protein
MTSSPEPKKRPSAKLPELRCAGCGERLSGRCPAEHVEWIVEQWEAKHAKCKPQ